jgi:DMSO/TMAO reductase YedYZ molybdopterin-dependent catalytic subunit
VTTRGFVGRSGDEKQDRLPPGQYRELGFPVLSYEPTPAIDRVDWQFSIDTAEGSASWTWDQMLGLPQTAVTVDIHCVTKWSKFDTGWEGVPVTEVMERLDVLPSATHVLLRAEHGFTANLPLEDFTREDNLFAYRYGGEELEADHGWPMRLVVPHLYFWKSVKWVRGFDLLDSDQPGFWERNGYHMYGDPFKEQRFWGD